MLAVFISFKDFEEPTPEGEATSRTRDRENLGENFDEEIFRTMSLWNRKSFVKKILPGNFFCDLFWDGDTEPFWKVTRE